MNYISKKNKVGKKEKADLVLKKLKEKLRYYKQVVINSTDAIIIQDFNGVIKAWNKSAERTYGFSAREIIGKNITKIIAPKYRVEAIKNIRAIKQGKPTFKVKQVRKTKNGEEIFINIIYSPIYEAGEIIEIGTTEEDVSELKKSKELAQKYLKMAGVMIVALDNKGKIVSMNEKGNEILGYKNGDLIGKDWLNTCVPFRIRKDVKDVFNKLMKGQIRNSEYYENFVKTKKGDERLVSWYHNLIRNGGGKIIGIISSGEDITEKRIKEKKLRESEERFRDIVLSSADWIWEVDKNGKYILIAGNPKGILGYYSEEILGKTPFDFMCKKEAKKIRKIFQSIASKKEPIKDLVNCNLTKAGKEVILLTNGVPILDKDGNLKGYRGVDKDITEKKKAELEIKKLAAISMHNTELINMSDLKGNMTFLNKAGRNMLGIKQIDVTKHHIFEVIPDNWMKLAKTKLLPTLRKGKIWEGDLAYKNLKTGKITDVHAIIFPVYDNKTGKPLFWANVSLDITREKEIDKMKSEFISIASHQLKTPLTGIKWTTELIKNEKIGKLNEKQKELVSQVHESNDRMLDLVSDLLDVSRIETGRKFSIVKKSVNIKDEIKKILNDEKILIKKQRVNIKFDNSFLKNVKIFVDKEKLGQACYNIIVNAIKYSKKGGKVEIGISKKDDKDITYFVKDNGLGIPKSQQKRVFEKFFRGSNIITHTDGTGLGLYITKAIIEAHAGKIWFNSNKKGTTVYFTLPIKNKKYE